MVSMCDPSIPLTTGEWLEWGNPNCSKFYEYMSFCPMQNIRKSRKPDVLITIVLTLASRIGKVQNTPCACASRVKTKRREFY